MYIKIENLGKKLGEKYLFSGVNLMLTDSHRIGIVGKNGTGKSTFLKMLLGEIMPDKGTIKIDPANAKVTYFSQILDIDKLALEIASIGSKNISEPNAFLFLLSRQKELFDIWLKMNFPDGTEDFSDLIDIYTENGGYELENTIFMELKKLGLDPEKKISEMSGGQKTRLQLAQLFVYKSEILLLDEPTNHLDIDGIELFYDFIKNFKGLVIITTHDRNLLTECINKIILFENCKVSEYSGNYEFYQNQRQIERIQSEERYRQNEKKISKLNEAASVLASRISRHYENKKKFNRAVERAARLDKKNKARKTKIIKTKLKLYRDNDKMQAKNLISRQQKKLGASRSVILDRAKKTSQQVQKGKIGWNMKLDFDTDVMDGDFALRIDKISSGYDDKLILKDFSMDLGSKGKIAITGPNGSGKSTLLKTIIGEITPIKGTIDISDQAKIGYLDQENLSLDHDSTVLSEFLKDAREMNDSEARAFLHFFLFEGDMPLRKVRTLSEGEKVKLKLAKLLYSKSNLLLLDEPTNHLDLPSQEVVEKALKDFDGAMIIISHDRVLLRNLGIKKEIKLN
jgi:ATP-binding cassette subfamily F protein 3